MTYSLPTLLVDHDYAQLVLLRDYLYSIAAAVSSRANALELAEPWNLTGINALREKHDYLRPTALAGAVRCDTLPGYDQSSVSPKQATVYPAPRSPRAHGVLIRNLRIDRTAERRSGRRR